MRASGLPIRVAWTNQNTLKRKLVKSALNPPPCPSGRQRWHACHAGLRDICHTKNVVYELTCNQCQEKYVGETSRPVRLRYNEHLRDGINRTPGTPIGEHFRTHHQEQPPSDTSLTAKVIRRCQDEADRRIAESVTIRENRPTLNDNTTSWQILPS